MDEATATSSLGAVLRLGEVKEREAYAALDWLFERQSRIEIGLARRHLEDGVLALLWQNDHRAGYAELNHLRQCGQRRSRARVM